MTPLDDLALVLSSGFACIAVCTTVSLRFVRRTTENARRDAQAALLEDPEYREERAKAFAAKRRLLERKRTEALERWHAETGDTALKWGEMYRQIGEDIQTLSVEELRELGG
jgi:hypothetical protein